MTDDDIDYVSPSSLGTYARCPRQYEFDAVWDVETPEETRRYRDRGLVLHATIEAVCAFARETDDDPVPADRIRERARTSFAELWDERTKRSTYHSDAHYRFDRERSLAAIESYFGEDAPGVEHARNSIASEVWVSFRRDGVALHGRVDNVVRTDDGLLVIDYKSSFGGIVSWRSADSIDDHLDEEDHHPGRVKSMFQAAAYIEGIKHHSAYEPGMEVAFTYYVLLADTTTEPDTDGVTVGVTGRGRDVADIYREYRDSVWALATRYYAGIVEEAYEPEPWELIRENACADCSYRGMCPDYVSHEVRIDE